MKLVMEKVLERDIDLLLMNAFMSMPEIADFFVQKAGWSSMQAEAVEHSAMTQDGESDITVVLSDGSKRFALLIEDKIDAAAMPRQYERYHLRGQQGIRDGKYHNYAVFIVAPQTYLNENAEAQKYEYRISYEELMPFFSEGSFCRQLLEEAIREKQKSYTPIEDANVTAFWKALYVYCAKCFPELNPYVYDGPRGSKAVWPTFRMPIKGTIIQFKSDRGFMDLELAGQAEHRQQFIKMNRQYLDSDMAVVTAGKSLAIRIKVPTLDFHRSFDENQNELEIALRAAVRLQKLLDVMEMVC